MAADRASNVVPFPGPRKVEPELIAALAAGDSDAITRTYREHAPKVRAYARRMLGDEAAAEDVVHDAFVALPRAMEAFRGDSKIDTFLIAIAVNLCRRRLRSSLRGKRAVERMEQRAVEPPVRTPEAEARRRELAAALTRGLETLSVEHREVFVLCAVEERSSPEVAALLDLPEGTIRTRLFHARKRLRAFLEREGVR
ncbi:MAG: RNA polymerase sigma factor [Sandaracinaceae bacterium]|nr:RNA polymerase sigma factor [Sandaracinaceae bacterium]